MEVGKVVLGRSTNELVINIWELLTDCAEEEWDLHVKHV